MVESHRTRAAVIYASRFGTTEKVARSFANGLQEADVQTLCADVRSIQAESLKDCDLICVGGPTEVFSATKPIKDFLRLTTGLSLEGKLGFAFDTKLDSKISGSAAKYIEHALDDQGLRMVANRESALVTSKKEGGRIVGATLKDGEEKRFEDIGRNIGSLTERALAIPSRRGQQG